MYTGKIKHIHIYGLWGVKDIETSFDPNVNIFIGTNGTNKTVFLNLLEAALTVDVNTLCSIEFSRIKIDIDAEIPFVEIAQISDDEKTRVQYRLDNVIYDLVNFPIRMRRFARNEDSSYQTVINKLHKMVNISWLSINRDNVEWQYIDSREIIERFKNMVDIKIRDMVKSLGTYQLQLESEANAISNEFKKEVMAMMLYDENMDYYSNDVIRSFREQDTDQLRAQLYKAFSAMGIAKSQKDSIEKHISKMREAINKLVHHNDKLDLHDVFVLALVKRTFEIIRISQKHEEQTNELFAPIDNFWKCLERFMPSKKFRYDKEKGELFVTLHEGQRKEAPISLSSLSSGEKQVFILLTEALLQRERNYLFIADEPELSLHIKWQKMIIPEMLKINPNAQIIVATHSPEVASHYSEKIINMTNISSYNE